jgi:hypothetical protein
MLRHLRNHQSYGKGAKPGQSTELSSPIYSLNIAYFEIWLGQSIAYSKSFVETKFHYRLQVAYVRDGPQARVVRRVLVV